MIKNIPLVSIIVPIFNAESYIKRCLDSIAQQTYKNIEVLLIDDGSKDASAQICNEYAKKDTRFVVVHKGNGGVASARQAGLELAKGEYIIHADPDDWVEPNWIESLYETAKNECRDIIICDYFKEYKNGTVVSKQNITSLKREDLLKDLIEERIWGSCWNKLVKRSCFDKYGVSFVNGMNLWEDLYVFTDLIYKGASVAYLPLSLYHYDCFSNSESIVRRPNISHIHSMELYIRHFETLLNDEIYREGFYKRQKLLKKRCFRSGKENADILISTFADINKRYIRENKFDWKEIRSYRGDIDKIERVCIAQCLKGHVKWGYFLFYFWKKYGTISFRDILNRLFLNN